MMNPEMMRAATEMMKNMRKEDLEAMTRQMQNMPSMPGMGGPGMPSPAMAAEMMKNMRPEDLQFMARQMESMPPEQLQRMAAQMGSGQAGPGGAGAMPLDASAVSGAARVLQQRQRYELDAAVRLKEEGNKLHGAGKYAEASEKYTRARTNLSSHSSSEAASVRKACTLNLMSCNLKLGKDADVVSLGNEIVQQDPKNLKALYRRGQALLKLGQLQPAVADLSEAAKLSPNDDTLAGVLREAKEALAEKQALGLSGDGAEGSKEEEENRNGVIIEDVTEQEEKEAEASRTVAAEQATRAESTVPAPPATSGAPALGPEAIRNIQAMSSMPPEQVAALSGGRITPEMARMASSLVSQMGPEELQRMMDMAARFGAPPAVPGSAPGAGFPGMGASPQTAPGGPGSTTGPTVSWSGSSSASASASARAGGAAGGGSAGAQGTAGLGDPLAGLAGAGGNPMEDPQMMKMMSDMMQSMSPEDLVAMSAQMGRPMTVEQARQTKELMSKVGPQHLATMMKWSNKAQGAMHQARQALEWLLRQPALLVAILVVVIAVVGRWLGCF